MSPTPPEIPAEHDDIEGVPAPSATYRLHGHGPAWAEFLAAQAAGRLHHAWALQGPRGIGKATAAFAFARHLLGGLRPEGASPGDPCFSAADPVARQIAQGSHPGLVHLTRPEAERGAGFKSQITIEEIRQLNRFFQTTSGTGWRVAIVDPADDMNRNAANALLKMLEEPPPRSIFLIVNHLPGRLLATIRSRCRVMRFEALPQEVLRRTLADMPVDLGVAEIEAALPLSEGSVRTALSLIGGGGMEIEAGIDRLWTADAPDWTAIHALADALTQKGRESAFDLLLASLFRRLGQEASGHVDAGDLAAARRAADLWGREADRWREGLAFNLDRKQMLISFFLKLFEARCRSFSG